MISVNNLSISFSGSFLFDNISFVVNEKDRIGLVGKNGAGKSTLLRIIAGLQEAEKGYVSFSRDETVGYLPQEMNPNSQKTVFDETLTAFEEAIALQKKTKDITAEIAQRSDYESEKYMSLIQKLNEANDRFQLIGGNSMQADTEKILLGLGFMHADFNRKLKEFSMGWQMRVELAKILLKKPSLLLLDEPTNHLDIESIEWLENFLINCNGAVILVSHDRAFLDHITKRTLEISLGKTYDYKACYSDYVNMRQERMELQMASYQNQQKEIETIEKFISRFRYKSTKARQVQSRIKMLDKMQRIEIDEIDQASIHFNFPPAPASGKVVYETKNLTKKYGDKLVLNNVHFSIAKSERIAFVGKNGEGKTTLTKIIAGLTDYQGEAERGYHVSIGYFAQNQAELLDPEKTIFQTIDDIAVGEVRSKIRGLLGGFLFSGDSIEKKVSVLSGGEKTRLALAKLLLTPSNLLILDEPTNHLDMQSKDILKNALLQYSGALIIVSHDRDFLQGLTTKVIEFKNHELKEYLGDVYDFLETRKIDSLQKLERGGHKSTQKKESVSENKVLWEKKKEHEKTLRKINSQIHQCEEHIEKIESKIKEHDEILANPIRYKEVFHSKELFEEYQLLQSSLKKEMDKWEILHRKKEELEK